MDPTVKRVDLGMMYVMLFDYDNTRSSLRRVPGKAYTAITSRADYDRLVLAKRGHGPTVSFKAAARVGSEEDVDIDSEHVNHVFLVPFLKMALVLCPTPGAVSQAQGAVHVDIPDAYMRDKKFIDMRDMAKFVDKNKDYFKVQIMNAMRANPHTKAFTACFVAMESNYRNLGYFESSDADVGYFQLSDPMGTIVEDRDDVKIKYYVNEFE